MSINYDNKFLDYSLRSHGVTLLFGIGIIFLVLKVVRYDPTSDNIAFLAIFCQDENKVIFSLIHGARLTFLMLLIHHLRLWCGLVFVDQDRSLKRAVLLNASLLIKNKGDYNSREQYNEQVLKLLRKKRTLTMITKTILFIVCSAFTYVLSDFSAIWLVLLLITNILLLWAYNFLYWKELFRLDKQRTANAFILIGDIVITITVLYIIMIMLNSSFVKFADIVLPLLVGAYCAIFFGELFSQYIPAFWISVQRVTVDFIRAFGDFRK